jgi:hypothetical protein
MANPAIIDITPKDTWVKVATAVTYGEVWVINNDPHYIHTYKLTGQAAPDNVTDRPKAVNLEINASIASAEEIDVYVMATGAVGQVRVDL